MENIIESRENAIGAGTFKVECYSKVSFIITVVFKLHLDKIESANFQHDLMQFWLNFHVLPCKICPQLLSVIVQNEMNFGAWHRSKPALLLALMCPHLIRKVIKIEAGALSEPQT